MGKIPQSVVDAEGSVVRKAQRGVLSAVSSPTDGPNRQFELRFGGTAVRFDWMELDRGCGLERNRGLKPWNRGPCIK
jgi:hypothetical protein